MADATRRWLGRTDSEASKADDHGLLGSSLPFQPKGALVRALSESPTLQRIRQVGEASVALAEAAGHYASLIPEGQRSAFLSEAKTMIRQQVGPMIDPRQTRSIAGVDDLFEAAALCLLLLFMMTMIWVAEHAPNPAMRRKGAEWRTKYEELRQQAQAATKTDAEKKYDTNKAFADQMVQDKAEAMQKCLDLNKLLPADHPCKKALEAVKKALDSLREVLGKKPSKRSTDGFKHEDLSIGIARAAGGLIQALANAADKCPNCSFLRMS